MVIYGISLVPPEEDLWSADTYLLTYFYTDNAPFDGSVRRSAQILKLLMERGSDQGDLLDPSKSLFTTDLLDQEDAENMEFSVEGLELNFGGGSRHLGAYLGPRQEF